MPRIVLVYLHSIFLGGIRKTIFSARVRVSAVQGHPRSLILVPITGASATSY